MSSPPHHITIITVMIILIALTLSYLDRCTSIIIIVIVILL